jgi:sporulation integral membrane protein YtvI
VAAGLGVCLTLVLFIGALSFLGALAVKELGNLSGAVPGVVEAAQKGMGLLEDWLVGLAGRMPEGIGTYFTGQVLAFFDGGTVLLDQLTQRLPGMVTGILGWLPDGLLGLGTGVVAGFMISARLPRLRHALQRRIPDSWRQKYFPAVRRVRSALAGWFRAQLKLMAVTYGIVCVGFLLLQIPYGFLWALLVAAVDAVPLLGTGTVLIPWAVVEALQGRYWLAVGLAGIYAAASIARTVLEPRLVGRQLGVDPLVMLLALYAGYHIWGFLGILLAPMLATVAKTVTEQPQAEDR